MCDTVPCHSSVCVTLCPVTVVCVCVMSQHCEMQCFSKDEITFCMQVGICQADGYTREAWGSLLAPCLGLNLKSPCMAIWLAIARGCRPVIDGGQLCAGQEEIQIQFPLLSCTLSNVHLPSMEKFPPTSLIM